MVCLKGRHIRSCLKKICTESIYANDYLKVNSLDKVDCNIINNALPVRASRKVW